MFGKERLVFDPAAADETDNIGAYIRANDGEMISQHTVGKDAASVVFQTITFTADNAGTAGNSIALVFDGIDDITTVVGAWNLANPSNTVSFSGQLGTYVPTAGTATLVGGTDSHGLDVWILNSSIVVTATDLDIRDLDFASDSVDVSGSSVSVTGDVNVTQGTSPWVVSANDLDIRDLVFATDKVDVSGSEVSLDAATLAALEEITVQNGAGAAAVNIQDGGNSITVDGAVAITGDVNVTQGTVPWFVSATDLDIRDLSHVQDNVAIAQGGNTLIVNADGSINVNADIDVVTGAEKAEDDAHISGDIGQYVLAVRQDTLASSVSDDGDYASFKVNAQGALYVDVSKASPASHTSWLVSQNTVNTDAELIVAADLTDRKKILIQNVSTGGGSGSKILYLGHSNAVASANGLRLSAGAAIELELAAGVAIWAISGAAGADIRIAELAA